MDPLPPLRLHHTLMVNDRLVVIVKMSSRWRLYSQIDWIAVKVNIQSLKCNQVTSV